MKRSDLFKTILATMFTVGGLFAADNVQGQTQNDTIWGTGVFHVKQENGAYIPNENILCKPLVMQGDTIPDTTYTFIPNNGGQALFELPVMIDLGTGEDENKQNSIDAIVAPNPSSDFTFAFHGKPTSDLHIYNILGHQVKTVQVNYDASKNISGAYIDMTNVAPGNYVFAESTKDGKVSGKIIKTNTPPVGNQIVNLPNSEPLVKSSNTWDATYDINISHEGYYNYNEQITISDGNNGLITFILEELPGTPQYQFIGGSVVDEEGNPFQDVTVWVKDQTTNELLSETVSQANGSYTLPDSLLTGTEFYFGVGGISNYYSFEGDEAFVVDEIVNLADTLKEVYKYVMYEKVRQVPGEAPGVTIQPTAAQVAELHDDSHVEYSIRDSILWYPTNEWTEPQVEGIRNTLENGMTLFGLEGAYSEVYYELNNVDFTEYDAYTNPFIGEIGVNVAPGTNSTSTYNINVSTPLGNNFFSTPASEMTISGIETSFYKEFFGRVFEFGEVSSRLSFMNNTATLPNHLDRAIVNMITYHYKEVFDEENPKAYFGLENIKDELSNK